MNLKKATLFRSALLLALPIVVVSACLIVDEFHYLSGQNTSPGFAATADGDFYAVNQGSSLGCYTNDTLNGTITTNGAVFRSFERLATSYQASPDAVWAVASLGTNYQDNWSSGYNILYSLKNDCKALSAAWMPFPPAGDHYWVYDIAVSDSGAVFVLVDDTTAVGNDVYKVFETSNGGANWTTHTIAPTEHAVLSGSCYNASETGMASMAYDRYNDEIVLLACDTQIRYDASTFAYLGQRSTGLAIGSGDLNDFDVFLSTSAISWDGPSGSELTVVSSWGAVLAEYEGVYAMDVQIQQPTAAAIDANPWGARGWVNGYDAAHSGRIHRYKFQ